MITKERIPKVRLISILNIISRLWIIYLNHFGFDFDDAEVPVFDFEAIDFDFPIIRAIMSASFNFFLTFPSDDLFCASAAANSSATFFEPGYEVLLKLSPR